jgi:CRP-like cAMP-binding protein
LNTPSDKAKLLKQGFDPFFQIPAREWEPLAQSGYMRSLNKETTIKEADKIENCLNLIVSGTACTLVWNENNFICTDLFFENEFALDFLSFITQEPTPYEVRTMENTEMFTVPHKAFEQFTLQSAYGDKIWRHALQALYIDKHYQYLQSLTMTATQRYKFFADHVGSLLQRIPQKYTASYLGVTQQSLSRMRRKIK